MSSSKEEIPLNDSQQLEKLTPYRICIAILIKIFHSKRLFDVTNGIPHDAKCTRDFCILLVKLLQKPDLKLMEFWDLLISKSHAIPQNLIHTYREKLKALLNDIDYFIEFINNLVKLTEYDTILPLDFFLITKNSVIGIYLRRLIVNFNKLTFFEVTEVYSGFNKYCEDLDWTWTIKQDVEECNPDKWTIEKDLWTRKQAELFIATQAALLESNEGKAMNPKELQQVILNILKTNPNLAEAHFLAYLNYLRIKEYTGALESLYGCFELNHIIEDTKSTEEKPKLCRYAALNLAVLHYHFNHHDETLASLKEAIKLAQDANDNLCLQHAIAWLNRLIISHNDKISEQSLLSSFSLSMSYRPSTSIQNCFKLSSLCSSEPLEILEALDKADIVYFQHDSKDLISNSYAIKSSLWQFYGKPEMSSLWSHLILYLNIGNINPTKIYYGEPFCLSVCNVAMHLLAEGKYNLSYCALNFLKLRFPDEPNNRIWMLCENIFHFLRALYNERWEEAEAAARRMLIVDKWESYLRLAELCLHKEDHKEARKFIGIILDRYKNNHKHEFKGYQYIRAKLLLAQIEFASNLDDSLPAGMINDLNEILYETKKYKLDYYTSFTYLVMANVQLNIGMANQALLNLEKCMTQILAHGGCYDRARCWLLYIKAITAESEKIMNEEERADAILERIHILGEVKDLFDRVEATSRVKDVVFLQAKLYDQLGMKEERNQHALEFRTLEKEHLTKNMRTLLRFI